MVRELLVPDREADREAERGEVLEGTNIVVPDGCFDGDEEGLHFWMQLRGSGYYGQRLIVRVRKLSVWVEGESGEEEVPADAELEAGIAQAAAATHGALRALLAIQTVEVLRDDRGGRGGRAREDPHLGPVQVAIRLPAFEPPHGHKVIVWPLVGVDCVVEVAVPFDGPVLVAKHWDAWGLTGERVGNRFRGALATGLRGGSGAGTGAGRRGPRPVSALLRRCLERKGTHGVVGEGAERWELVHDGRNVPLRNIEGADALRWRAEGRRCAWMS